MLSWVGSVSIDKILLIPRRLYIKMKLICQDVLGWSSGLEFHQGLHIPPGCGLVSPYPQAGAYFSDPVRDTRAHAHQWITNIENLAIADRFHLV